MQERLTPIVRRRVDAGRANIAGRNEEWYAASADVARLSPSPSIPDLGTVVIAALAANRPQAAVELNAEHSLLEVFLDPSQPFGAFYVMTLTGALHQLGEHEEELKMARRGKETYPHLLNLHAYEARALVALGRIAEAERLVADILAMPSQWAWPSCCLPRATPGYVMICAAEEMRTHGHRDASLKMAAQAAEWYGSRVGEEAREEETRAHRAEALYRAERWDEARAAFSALAREHPENIDYLARLGSLAARRGDRAEALRTAEKLRTLDRPYLLGKHTYRSARILALLGDREGATARLREAVAQGSPGEGEPDQYGYGFVYRHAMDLEPLPGYPPFEELIKPKG
jgi:predicted Zn-dependent protease